MASNDDIGRSSDSETLGDLVHNQILFINSFPVLPQIKEQTTEEELTYQLHNYQRLNIQLQEQVAATKRELRREKKVNLDTKDELKTTEKSFQYTKTENEKLRERNMKLFANIKECEKLNKILEKNKKELLQKLEEFNNKEKHEVVKVESNTLTNKTEKELQDLKQQLQAMSKELEDKSKLNEKLDRNTHEVKEVKHLVEQNGVEVAEKYDNIEKILEENRSAGDDTAKKVDNMEHMLKQTLAEKVEMKNEMDDMKQMLKQSLAEKAKMKNDTDELKQMFKQALALSTEGRNPPRTDPNEEHEKTDSVSGRKVDGDVIQIPSNPIMHTEDRLPNIQPNDVRSTPRKPVRAPVETMMYNRRKEYPRPRFSSGQKK